MSSGSPGPRGLPARLQKLRLPRSRGPRPGQRPALPSEEGGPREEGSHVTAGPALRRPGAGMGRAFKARPGRPSREPSCRRRSRSRAETAARSLVAAFASKAGRGALARGPPPSPRPVPAPGSRGCRGRACRVGRERRGRLRRRRWGRPRLPFRQRSVPGAARPGLGPQAPRRGV